VPDKEIVKDVIDAFLKKLAFNMAGMVPLMKM
jgi:hypothetical protein